MDEQIKQIIENDFFKDILKGVLSNSEVTLIYEDSGGERRLLTDRKEGEDSKAMGSQVYLSPIKIGSSRCGKIIGYDTDGKDQSVSLLVALTASLIINLLSNENSGNTAQNSFPADMVQ